MWPGTSSQKTPPGWARVQAICDFVQRRIAFAMSTRARPKTSLGSPSMKAKAWSRLRASRHHLLPLHEHSGALIAPATSGDIGVPPALWPDGFAGWFEAYLGGRWYTFDARKQHSANRPRADSLKGAMRLTCRSPTPSAPTRWSASRSGPTRSARACPAKMGTGSASGHATKQWCRAGCRFEEFHPALGSSMTKRRDCVAHIAGCRRA